MKYIVIISFKDSHYTKIQPILCDSIGAVYEAICETQYRFDSSWSVWENVNGKAEKCIVRDPYDMQNICIYPANLIT